MGCGAHDGGSHGGLKHAKALALLGASGASNKRPTEGEPLVSFLSHVVRPTA